MKFGVLGGSFDPPHVAHSMLCMYVLETEDIERILWVPSDAHPFGKNMAPFEDRLAMSRLAADPLGELVQVLDVEKNLPSPNYTIDLLRHLAEQYPADNFRLIVGSDILKEQHKWEGFDKIEREFNPIIIARRGFEVDDCPAVLPDIQSRVIRRRMKEGKPVEHLVSRRVLQYIREYNIYDDLDA